MLFVPAAILGWIAVAQIRRSAGKLYGLWLAVFDGLLFPLLVLDVVILRLVCFVWQMTLGGRLDAGPSEVSFAAAAFIGGAIAIAADFLIIRAVWRAVSKGTTPQVPSVGKTGAAEFQELEKSAS